MNLILKLLQVVTLFGALTWTQTPSGSCEAQWQMSELIQQTKTLTISSPADQINQSYNLTFAGSFFSSPPRAIVSTSHLDVSRFTEVNYRIIPQVFNTSATVSFQSRGMSWAQVRITVWLSSRADMFVGTIVGENFQPNSNAPVNLTIQTSSAVSFFEDNRTIYLNYINGLQASSAQRIYEVNISAASKSVSSYTVSVRVNAATTLTYLRMDYIIYNTEISLFSSGGGYYASSNIVGPYYQKIHKNFLPIQYKLLGFQSIRVANQNEIHLDINIDDDTILGVSGDSTHPLANARVVYLTIGQKSNLVCASCPNLFIYQKSQNCITNCPAQAYPYSNYIPGGKSCLTCSAKVFETINPDRTGCICLAGYSYNGNNQCVLLTGTSSTTATASTTTTTVTNFTQTNQTITNSSSSNSTQIIIIPGGSTNTCSGNSVLFEGTCFPCTSGLYKSGIQCLPCPTDCQLCSSLTTCAQCRAGLIPNVNGTACIVGQTICQVGFYRESQACLPCKQGCSACESLNVCTACSQGYLLHSTNRTCYVPLTSCPLNSTLTSQGTCVCDEFSMVNGIGCFRCVNGSYLNQNKMCVQCTTENCFRCNSSNICVQCLPNFILQPNSLCLSNVVLPTCDRFSILQDNGTCLRCPNGSFKEGNNCSPCSDARCIQCSNSSICELCMTGFILSQDRRSCGCGENKIIVGQLCQCDSFSYLALNGNCTRCFEGFYPSRGNCAPCVAGCGACINGQSCIQCIGGLTYNQTLNQCVQPVTCPIGATLVNGACVCDGENVLSNSICSPCPSNTFKSGSVCLDCIQGCSTCRSSTTCLVCANNHTFNSITVKCECVAPNYILNGTCAPCPAGLVYSASQLTCIAPGNTSSGCTRDQNGNCVCNSTSVLRDQICVDCGAGYYKNGNDCISCIAACTRCANGNSCEACLNGTVYSVEQNACVIPGTTPIVIPSIIDPACAGQNQELVNGVCVCNNRSLIEKNDDSSLKCVYCGDRYYPNANKTGCLGCIGKCLVCYESSTCIKCEDGYTGPTCNSCGENYTRINGYCRPSYCGNGKIDVIPGKASETCDDNNDKSADGCSQNCQVENGYFCHNNSNNSSTCRRLFNLTDTWVNSAGICLKFEALEGEKEDIQVPVIVNGPAPHKIYERTDPNDPDKKVFFLDYCGVLPPEQVTVRTTKNGNNTAQYNLKYDLNRMRQV